MCVKGIKDLILKKKKVSKNWKGLLINKAWKMLHFKAWKVPIKYWMQISAYTKNWLVSWSDNKELLSETDVIGWNLKKKKKKVSNAKCNATKLYQRVIIYFLWIQIF